MHFVLLPFLSLQGELTCTFRALKPVAESGLYSLRLPNKYNFAFDYQIALIIVMFMYVPGEYALHPDDNLLSISVWCFILIISVFVELCAPSLYYIWYSHDGFWEIIAWDCSSPISYSATA